MAHADHPIIAALQRVLAGARAAQAVRACLITTRDREQAFALVQAATTAAQTSLHGYSAASRRRFNAESLEWRAGGDGEIGPSTLLGEARASANGGFFVLEDCLCAMDHSGEGRRARAVLAEMLAATEAVEARVLVFVESPEAERLLPAMLADQIVRLPVPYPRAPELQELARVEIAAMAHRNKSLMAIDAVREQAERLGDALVGYTRKAARDAIRDALGAHPGAFDCALTLLTEQKVQRLSRELAMNVLDTSEVEAPAGLEHLLSFLEISRARMREFGKGRSRGVLLVGPPGTGKTMLAKAVGRLVGLPVVEFRISSLMNSLLGETERLFTRAFATLEAMAPSVVFIDEIEKAFGDSSERDGGTMMRVTGSLLSWLSDNPQPNFIVATCNSLTRMGEIGLAMTRSERFDAAYFVDVPALRAREQILARCLNGRARNPAALAATLAGETARFSGADLFSLVKQAAARAQHAGETLVEAHLHVEIERKRPRVDALYQEFNELRRWGRMYCEPAGEID